MVERIQGTPNVAAAASAAKPLTERLKGGLDAARARAEDLRHRFEENAARTDGLREQSDAQRLAMAQRELEDIDELLSAFLLVAEAAAARGDANLVGRMAQQAEGLMDRATGDVERIRMVWDSDTTTGAGEKARRESGFAARVHALTAKVRALGGLMALAVRNAEERDDRDEARALRDDLERAAATVERAARPKLPDGTGTVLDRRV